MLLFFNSVSVSVVLIWAHIVGAVGNKQQIFSFVCR